MNPASTNLPTPDGDLIDRLVDGELPDVERRELLVRLENEPGGWRRCALAFLEAQLWRQAMTSVAATAVVPALSAIPDHPLRKMFSWRPLVRLTGLAASLTAAFFLGWAYHHGLEQKAPSGTVAVSPAEGSQRNQGQVVAEYSNPGKSSQALASIDPFVKRLQQQGYSVETENRLVSMESKDGRKVKLPVKEVRIRDIRDRIY
jgi:hypothetical protein